MSGCAHCAWNLLHHSLEYYDLVNVSQIVVVSYSTTQSAVTFTVNIEQVSAHV